MTIETPEQLRREIAYRVDERIGISVGSGIPSKFIVEFANEEATQWARKHYPELYSKAQAAYATPACDSASR